MHKDLNAVKGGDKLMVLFWASIGVPGPVLLANKDNTVILSKPQDDRSRAHKHAMEQSG